MRLRVATYNIRKCVGLDWRRRPERVLGVIASLRAHVVALQEADRRFGARLAALPRTLLEDAGWHVADVAPHTGGIGWHGNALIVRRSVTIEDAARLKLPYLEPRGAILVDASIDGQPLRIVGAHMGLTQRRRAAQAAAIAAAIAARAPRPTVFMGDLNEWRRNGRSLNALSPALSFAPPKPTFHARHRLAPFDRIAISKDLEMTAHGVIDDADARVASDHLPLWADVTLSR